MMIPKWAFEKTIEFFHTVLQRNVTAEPPTPKRTYDVSRGKKSICEASLKPIDLKNRF